MQTRYVLIFLFKVNLKAMIPKTGIAWSSILQVCFASHLTSSKISAMRLHMSCWKTQVQEFKVVSFLLVLVWKFQF